MKSVLLRGPVLTQSGYGVHTRQIAHYLLNQKNIDLKFNILPWGNTPWILDRDYDNGLIGKIMDRSNYDNNKIFDITLQVQLPNEWDTKLGKYNIGITAAVETDKAPQSWINFCNSMNMVIVPSQHSKLSLTNSSNGLLNKDIHIIPEAFNNKLNESNDLLNNHINFDTNFNFLVFGQLTGTPENDRKNLFNTIKVLCEEFKNDSDVGIILKTNSGRMTHIDRQKIISLFKSFLKNIRPGLYPKVHLLHGDMDDIEVAKLYKNPTIKAIVSLTRGEGYGLPLIDAAAAGLPIIATGWSGYLDFLKHGKYINVDYTLQQVPKSKVDKHIFVSESRWAEPSLQSAAKKIVKFRNQPEIPTQWAKELSKIILKEYSQSSIEMLYNKLLGDLFKC